MRQEPNAMYATRAIHRFPFTADSSQGLVHGPLKVRQHERNLAGSTTMAGHALRRLRPCSPSGTPTRPNPAGGTSPPPTRCTPGSLNSARSWDHDSFSATVSHDARHAPPHC
jgi:hypothetical protein